MRHLKIMPLCALLFTPQPSQAFVIPSAPDSHLLQRGFLFDGNQVLVDYDVTTTNPSFVYNGFGLQVVSDPTREHLSTTTSVKSLNGQVTASAELVLDFFFGVFGKVTTPIPIHVKANAIVSTSGAGNANTPSYSAHTSASADAEVFVEGTAIASAATPGALAGASIFGNFKQTSAFSNYMYFITNQYYGVQMHVYSQSSSIYQTLNSNGLPDYASYLSTAFAYADPIFEIDPSFPDATQYSLSFSPGIQNGVSAIPLPASAPLFGAALMALSAVGYGLKRKGKAAAA